MDGELSGLFAFPESFTIVSLQQSESRIVLSLVVTTLTSRCPRCGKEASHVRGTYMRTVADTPCGSQPVCLLIMVRKFRCETPECPQKIFTERLGPFLGAWARQTTRLRQMLEAIVLATSGEAGARLAARLHVTTSPTTLLRRLMALPCPSPSQISHLGVDDFALRRGRKYGTVLVNLVTHQIVDLLPDRKADTLAAWLRLHPEVDLVSRDRAEEYASGIRLGAPHARQCADRFHLVKNLEEAVEKAIARCRTELRQKKADQDPPPALPEQESEPSVSEPWSAHEKERYERFQQVKHLREQGVRIKEIALQTGIGQRTIQRWVTQDTYVPTNYHHAHHSIFDIYVPYLQRRWEDGCHTGEVLWREIRAQGYPHSSRAFRQKLESLFGKKVKASVSPPSPLDLLSTRDAAWFVIRPWETLKEAEQTTLTLLRESDASFEDLYQLVQEFLTMVHTLGGNHLDSWIEKVTSSSFPDLQSFAAGVLRDKEAVQVGLTESTNNDRVAYCTSSLG